MSHSIAQDENNLVLNPSFESMSGKLKKLKQINIAKEWDSPTALKADLYSTEKDLGTLFSDLRIQPRFDLYFHCGR